MKNNKQRLDIALVERGLCESRSRAAALVLADKVRVNGQPARQAAALVKADDTIEVLSTLPWVSRGGLKLAAAVAAFAPPIAGAVLADIGASTGGFTDVLLHHGAARVYAVDVGYGQLAWKLQQDPRVVVLDRLNARYLTSEHIPQALDGLVADCSFISLKTVLTAPLALAKPGAFLLALIKPQFEAGRGAVGKGGIVRDAATRQEVCAEVTEWLTATGWPTHGLIESPLQGGVEGGGGNVEYLVYAVRAGHKEGGEEAVKAPSPTHNR
jgi:23S rRNA (cytidine1920-2'-O)/16S rRNA (cytidine1409-2'-O)-methyltransferase